MDPIKPSSAPVDPSDLSYQVMPQEGHFDPVVQSAAPAPARPASTPIMPQRSSPPPPPPPQSLAGPSNLMPDEPRSSFFRSKWLYILAAIVVLAGLGVLAYFMLWNKPAAPVAETQTTKLPKVWMNQYFSKDVCDTQTVCGDDADPDLDGLKNYDEFKAGTNPNNKDTDSDGIADGDEVNIYKTEPTLKYTDRRDIVAQNDWTDGFQAMNGYDPLTPGLKFTDVRNQQIATDTAKFSLHEPSIATLHPPIQTYTSQNGFEFQYPSSWKKVIDITASTSDYLPAGRNFTAIYKSAYPAQDFDARVDVYSQPLKTVLSKNTFVKGGVATQVILNGIAWTKSVKTLSKAVTSTEYLVEHEGKTFEVSGTADIVGQILSAFKFSVTAPTPAAVTPPTGKTINITIQNASFSPSTVTVSQGDTVVWTNKDTIEHTVTWDSGAPSAGNIKVNGTFSSTFNTAGIFTYHCAIHPVMTGSVTVK